MYLAMPFFTFADTLVPMTYCFMVILISETKAEQLYKLALIIPRPSQLFIQ